MYGAKRMRLSTDVVLKKKKKMDVSGVRYILWAFLVKANTHSPWVWRYKDIRIKSKVDTKVRASEPFKQRDPQRERLRSTLTIQHSRLFEGRSHLDATSVTPITPLQHTAEGYNPH